jgi:hypothetical protein
MASAILAAYDPRCFTVMDELAWKALKQEKMLPKLSPSHRPTKADLNRAVYYEQYLHTCRNLAMEYGVPLRILDRCLWWMGKHIREQRGERCC